MSVFLENSFHKLIFVFAVYFVSCFYLLSVQKSKNESKSEAMELLYSSVARVEEMQKIYSELFHYDKLSVASNDFKEFATIATNEKVARAVTTTLDQVSTQSTLLNKLDYFITLHIPTIEDGGNFGVGCVWFFNYVFFDGRSKIIWLDPHIILPSFLNGAMLL